MEFTYKPNNVCSTQIHLEIENGIVSNVSFVGGCNGNLKAVSKLVNGMPAAKIEEILAGNTCGRRDTSCADQLAKAVHAAAEEEKRSKSL
jgi:uncharacterized protein (TIGR03905 family)